MSAEIAFPRKPAGDPILDAARSLGAEDLEASLAALRRASVDEAGTPRFNLMMSLVAWRMGEIERAVSLAVDCHQREPMNGTIAEVLGSLFAQVGNLDDSLYYGKLAIALGAAEGFADLLPPDFPTFDRALLAIEERPLLVRGRFLLASGDLHGGLDLLRQHVALTAADDEARLELGEAMLRAGQAGAAVEVIETRASAPGAAPAMLSLCARALAAAGEPARSRRFHELACTAANDSAFEAARIADAFWDEREPQALVARIDEWSRRFLPPPRAPGWSRPEEKLVIGYLVSRLADPRDAATIASVAAAHNRARVRVVAFGHGAQAWAANAELSGAFDHWRDIAGIDGATLARILRGEGLHAIVDCAGFAAPAQISALGRLNTAIRVAWLGIPTMLDAPVYDAVLGGGAGSLPRWGASYPLAFERMRQLPRLSAVAFRFGADVTMAQLDVRTIALWSKLLRAQAGAVLLLRGNDMGPGPNIDRLVERFGRELAARIDVVEAGSSEEFYRRVDLALAPFRGTSARMAAEALTAGVPVVAIDAEPAFGPYASFLRERGLAAAVAESEQEYVGVAGHLAASAEARRQMIAPLAEAAGRDREPRGVAAVIEERVIAMLTEAPS